MVLNGFETFKMWGKKLENFSQKTDNEIST